MQANLGEAKNIKLLEYFTATTRMSVVCDDGNFSFPKECGLPSH